MVPEEVYDGLNYGTDKFVHGEFDAVLKGYMDQVIKNKNKELSTAWHNGLEGILDAYLGEKVEILRLDHRFAHVKTQPYQSNDNIVTFAKNPGFLRSESSLQGGEFLPHFRLGLHLLGEGRLLPGNIAEISNGAINRHAVEIGKRSIEVRLVEVTTEGFGVLHDFFQGDEAEDVAGGLLIEV